MQTATAIRDALNARRGTWPTLCEATGLSYWWVTKFAQGRIAEPGLSKVQKLVDYFDAHPVPTAAPPPISDVREAA